MKLSIVSTLYHSAPYVQEFHARASKAAQQLVGEEYEIILVNDGSPDNSLELAVAIAQHDSHTIVVDLSRNFGHHKAMMTGLSFAKSERVFLIDSDLEEEPEWLASFAASMISNDCDVVYGVQAKRKGGFFERISGYVFYRLFRFLTGVNLPDNIVTARLMSRPYVDALVSHREREVNIGGLWVTTGFNQFALPVVKHATSPTTYTLTRRMSILVTAVTSFSSKPLEYIFYMGGLISVASLIFVLYLVYRYLFIAIPPSGYTSIIASIWLLSGLIILVLGILGIYVSRVYSEVKQRPYTVVKRLYYNTSSSEDRARVH
jgi:putative glycosyltransferase